jgi:drug/metabolite transporter (DMT)-like permease
MSNDQLKNQLLLHGIVLIWGFTGILGKLISLDASAIVWYRMIIAFLGLGLYLKATGFSISDSFKNILSYLGIGIIVAIHWILFFEAIKVSTVSVALATMASSTLFTSILEPLFYKRRIIPYEIVFGLLVILGLALIFNVEADYQLGIVLALASAFCASLFTTINGYFVSKGSKPKAVSFYEMFGGAVGISVYFLISGSLEVWTTIPSIEDFGYLLVLGLICTSLAFVVSVEVMKHVSPFTVSISINMEPIYSIILALLFFGDEEKMSLGFYAGATIILATIGVNAWLKKRQRRHL